MNTRVAPSPTGYFHLGTARTAYFNYLAARATGGKFILRIDDTDLARNKPEYVDNILKVFDWLGLEYDELHYQSQRFSIYENYAYNLLESGIAHKEDSAIIADLSKYVPETWKDILSGTNVSSDDDRRLTTRFVCIKADGTPSYNFSSIIDDYMLGITDVIRGIDHYKNTPRQLAVARTCDWAPHPGINFTHIGLIFENGKKMSKRDGALSVTDYMERGYSAQALLNHVLKLGWGHPNPLFDKQYKTVSKQDAIALFLEGNMRASKSSHDTAKLDSLNKAWNKILSPKATNV